MRARTGRTAQRCRNLAPLLTPVSAAGRRRRPTCAPDSSAPRPGPRCHRPRLLPPRRRDGNSASWPHSSAPWPTASRRPPPPQAGPRTRPCSPGRTTRPWPVSWATRCQGWDPPLRARTARHTSVNKLRSHPFPRRSLSGCAAASGSRPRSRLSPRRLRRSLLALAGPGPGQGGLGGATGPRVAGSGQ